LYPQWQNGLDILLQDSVLIIQPNLKNYNIFSILLLTEVYLTLKNLVCKFKDEWRITLVP